MDSRHKLESLWSKWKRHLLGAGATSLLLLLTFIIFRPSEPLFDRIGFSQVVYDRRGEVLRITTTEDEKYRIQTHVNSTSPLLTEAILLKEDKFFYYHPGFNAVALVRAGFQTYVQRQKKIGGSTISMQVARLYYNLNTRTGWGKLKQIFYAIYLETYYSKNEILAAYINRAPCGGNIEGFAAASRIYFGKDLIDLTLAEALFLSVLPQNPSGYHPKTQAIDNDLLQARSRLFDLWQEEHPESQNESVHFDLPLDVQYHLPFRAPHYVSALLHKHQGERKIHGTLDLKLQDMVTRLTKRYVQRNKKLGVHNAAVLLVDFENMEVLASLGSADFFNDRIEGQVNGTRARRSPGSTLKPFIYALAMEQGLVHPMTMLKDAPTSFSEYSPDNYERDFKGPIPAWQALVTSRNVPAVALASKITNPDLYDFIHKTGLGGLKEKDHYGLSIVLGSAEFSMEELVTLYGILANDGIFQGVVDSFDSSGEDPAPVQTPLSPEVCFLVLDMLKRNAEPTSIRVPIHEEPGDGVAFKTGTSIGFKDCWSIAIFDKYILAVWLGNFNGYGNPAFNGRYLATPLLFEILDSIRSNRTDTGHLSLGRPLDITETTICAASGQIAYPYCTRQVSTLYLPGKSPITKCRICREIYVDTKTGYRTFKRQGQFIKKQVYEFWSTDLLTLFRKAGIPRKVPPPFDLAENLDLLSVTGISPAIVSPVKDVEYVLRQEDRTYNNLPLEVSVDADVHEVYWFVDEKYIGKASPNQTQYWSLSPGTFQIGVVDDHGRSDYQEVRIIHIRTSREIPFQ